MSKLISKNSFAILAVDDDASILDVVQGSLDIQGYHADFASDGNKAIEILKNSNYNLLISDIQMPGANGVEVAAILNQLGTGIRIIFITGGAKEDTVLKAIKERPFGFLEKPFSPDELLKIVDEAYNLWTKEKEQEHCFIKLEETVQEKTRDLKFHNERLLAEKELMKGLISQANFGLIAVDTGQKVHIMNPYAVDILGVSSEYSQTYIGMPLELVLDKDTFLRFNDLYHNVVAAPRLYEINDIDYKKERERNIIVYPIRYRDNITAVVFVIHDITDNQILQKRLLQSEKLASIGELAAGVAHEINNPLGFVTSNCNRLGEYVNNMIKYIEGGSSSGNGSVSDKDRVVQLRKEYDIDYIFEDIGNLLSETNDGLNRVSQIVQDLKMFARSDSDEPQEKNVNQLIDDALNLVRNELKYNITINKKFGQIPNLLCFPNQLVQVFTNLFINVSHAIKKHGNLEIATGTKDTVIWISIKDDGCGIPEKILPKIFDPFFTTKQPGKGTGMGLSISYGIIQRHGGTIMVESQVGQGTTFNITLPQLGVKYETVQAATIKPVGE